MLAVIALILFPLWPYDVKYLLWKASLYLSVFLFGLIIVRVILYMLLSIFGMSFWIFPRLFDNCSTL